MGDGAVGKTCLLTTVALGNFPKEYIPTIMDNFRKDVKMEDNTDVFLTIWDTAGQEDFARIRRLSYMDTDCFIICFSVAEKTSLRNVTEWYKDLKENLNDENILIILVGTKCDLRDDPKLKDKCCTLEDIEMKKLDIEAFDYVETSALKNINNDKVFEEVARKLMARKKIEKLRKSTRKKSIPKKKKPKKVKKAKVKGKTKGLFGGIASISGNNIGDDLEYMNSLREDLED